VVPEPVVESLQAAIVRIAATRRRVRRIRAM
jgi:hypothetical protein